MHPVERLPLRTCRHPSRQRPISFPIHQAVDGSAEVYSIVRRETRQPFRAPERPLELLHPRLSTCRIEIVAERPHEAHPPRRADRPSGFQRRQPVLSEVIDQLQPLGPCRRAPLGQGLRQRFKLISTRRLPGGPRRHPRDEDLACLLIPKTVERHLEIDHVLRLQGPQGLRLPEASPELSGPDPALRRTQVTGQGLGHRPPVSAGVGPEVLGLIQRALLDDLGKPFPGRTTRIAPGSKLHRKPREVAHLHRPETPAVLDPQDPETTRVLVPEFRHGRRHAVEVPRGHPPEHRRLRPRRLELLRPGLSHRRIEILRDRPHKNVPLADRRCGKRIGGRQVLLRDVACQTGPIRLRGILAVGQCLGQPTEVHRRQRLPCRRGTHPGTQHAGGILVPQGRKRCRYVLRLRDLHRRQGFRGQEGSTELLNPDRP